MIFWKKTPKTSMTLIKKLSDMEYVLMDAILIITSQHPGIDVSKLQYELLKCGLMVQQPLIKDAIKELKKHKALSGAVSSSLN